MKILFWIPRVLSVFFLLFLSLFAFDVFNGSFGIQEVFAFIIHLLPVFLLALFTALAWKHDGVGILAYGGVAVLYVALIGFHRPWSWYALISGPALFISLLNFVHWHRFRHRV